MFDLKEIKAISCVSIANDHGIQLKQKHNRLWGSLRDEKTPSFSINLDNNLWYDFGAGKGGSVIDLVAELEGITSTEAINKLAEQHGLVNEKSNEWQPLTDSQYRELGIRPERATLNFGIDLEKHDMDQVTRWSSKYGISVKDMAKQFPDAYNKMVTKIAHDIIGAYRDSYFLSIKLFVDPTIDDFTKGMSKYSYLEDAKAINRKVDLLQRALTKFADCKNLRVDPELDVKNAINSISNAQEKTLSEDERIRDRIVKVYKRLYNYDLPGYFTTDQAKALHDLNIALSSSDNKFLPIAAIKELYDKIGKSLESMTKEYDSVYKEGDLLIKDSEDYSKWTTKVSNVKSDLIKVKDLFSKCNTVIEGIRMANLQERGHEVTKIDKVEVKNNQFQQEM